MMKSMSLKVEQELCAESTESLCRFLRGLQGVESVQVDRKVIGIRFDEARIPDEQLFAMTKSSVEMLGYHLTWA